MPAVLINHRVSDYNTWLKHYEDHEPKRRAAGITNSTVWQASDDPQNVYVLLECTDIAQVQQFAASEDLKQTMAKAGVIGKPTATFLTGGQSYPRSAAQYG